MQLLATPELVKPTCCPDCQRWGQQSQQNQNCLSSDQWISDDFAAGSRNSEKNLCWVLKIDVCLRWFCELAKMKNVWFLTVRKI